MEADVVERLEKKASVYDYGFLKKEIAGFRLSLDPLIDNKFMLR